MANADEVKPNANDGTATEAAPASKTVKEESQTVKEESQTVKEESEPVKEEKKPIVLTKELEAKIIRQVEYYFGDINLPKDKFLQEQIGLDDGWVPLSVLLTFNRLLSICPEADIIAQALLNSENDVVVVSDDKTKIRRNPDNPVPEYNDERRKELITRTAYVKGFPHGETFEKLTKFLEPFGPYESVHMRSYKDRLSKTNVFKGSVFIIFKTIDACKAFMDLEEVKYNDTVLIKKWQADYWEEKSKEREERNERRGRNKKDNTESKGKEATTKKHNFPKGSVLHMRGFKDSTARETIKEEVTKLNEKEPAFITFDKGDKEGYIRFSDENGAVDFIAKLTDSKFAVDEADITVRALEGEEEDTFLNEVYKTISKIKSSQKFSSRNKHRKRRGGGGDGGPRAKQPRK